MQDQYRDGEHPYLLLKLLIPIVRLHKPIIQRQNPKVDQRVSSKRKHTKKHTKQIRVFEIAKQLPGESEDSDGWDGVSEGLPLDVVGVPGAESGIAELEGLFLGHWVADYQCVQTEEHQDR